MTPDLLLALAVFAFVASITPGPNNTMLLASGANFGFRPTIPHMLGINLGLCVMVLSVGLGIGGVFSAFPALHGLLRYGGALYLLWLAWRIARTDGVAAGTPGGKPLGVLRAAAFQWVNPKAWVMIVGAVAVYVPQTDYTFNMLVVTAVFALVTIPCLVVWAGFGAALRGVLGTPRRLRVFNAVMALLLVASLYPLLWPG